MRRVLLLTAMAVALVVMANAPAIWEWAEKEMLIPYNSHGYNVLLYAVMGLMPVLCLIGMWLLMPTKGKMWRTGRFIVGMLAGSFLGDVVQALLPSPAYTAIHEVVILAFAVNLSLVVEVIYHWRLETGKDEAARRATDAPTLPQVARGMVSHHMAATEAVVKDTESTETKERGRIGFVIQAKPPK